MWAELPPLLNHEFLLTQTLRAFRFNPEGISMNALKRHRENILVSKAELARQAELSVLTIDRIEKGKRCRLSTKKKIIEALGLKLSEKNKIFPDGSD